MRSSSVAKFGKLSALALVASAAVAAAQSAPKPAVEERRRQVTYEEIERGFFFEARGGFSGIINPIASSGPSYFSPGQSLGIDMGFDIGERVSPAIFFLASTNRMGSDYTGINTTGTASGDFSSFTPGAAVKVRLVGFDDSQQVRRTWIYVRAGGGATFYMPTTLLPQLDVLITGGPGIEYYTRLRHLIIGFEANFNFMALTQMFGFNTLLTVKYAF